MAASAEQKIAALRAAILAEVRVTYPAASWGPSTSMLRLSEADGHFAEVVVRRREGWSEELKLEATVEGCLGKDGFKALPTRCYWERRNLPNVAKIAARVVQVAEQRRELKAWVDALDAARNVVQDQIERLTAEHRVDGNNVASRLIARPDGIELRATRLSEAQADRILRLLAELETAS